ncbi:putative 3-mercaptopyruvate sulfurtransferase [Cyclospora cayetanensis]|uniref:3-mercaptopyruvate sulfurtransferase n=1 Tax=Cyclospora cayetanensis TaxID=88456 RepID=A0A1D3CUK8_9EIME|nr:putative 3-mercaptopyruvate sulfurtransferase [Cyclospora cayetanensis]
MLRWGGWSSRILNGGLKAWIASAKPLDRQPLTTDTLLPLPEGGSETASNASVDAAASSGHSHLHSTYEDVLQSLDELAASIEACTKQSTGTSSSTRTVLLVDARSHERFWGLSPEPREGLFGGHIPSSVNLFFVEVLQPHAFFPSNTDSTTSSGPTTYLCPFETSAKAPPFGYATLKTGAPLLLALAPLLLRANVGGISQQLQSLSQQGQHQRQKPSHLQEDSQLDFSRAKRIVCTCGTGVTACIVYLALLKVGYPEALLSVYDGSWTEWAERRLTEGHQEGSGSSSSLPTLIVPPPTQQQQDALRSVIQARQRAPSSR